MVFTWDSGKKAVNLAIHGIVLGLFIPVIVIAGTVGLVARFAINWLARRGSHSG
jgi:hypothetical protein